MTQFPPTFDERNIESGFGGGCGHTTIIPLFTTANKPIQYNNLL